MQEPYVIRKNFQVLKPVLQPIIYVSKGTLTRPFQGLKALKKKWRQRTAGSAWSSAHDFWFDEDLANEISVIA